MKFRGLKKVRFSLELWKRPDSGSYSCFRQVANTLWAGNWYTCREEFQSQYPTTSNILFCCNRREMANVITIIRKVEQKLRISTRTKCGPTNKNQIMWIRVSPWWRTVMRRSLFLAILRDARRTSRLDKLGQRGDYIHNTRPAFNLFLEGHTRFQPMRGNDYDYDYDYDYERPSSYSGWVYFFRHMGKQEARQLLRRAG
jgi:hypothetical protein